MEEKSIKLLIKPLYQCNSNCVFCAYQNKRNIRMLDKDEIIEWYHYATKIYDFDEVIISGGEPTIYNDLFYLLSCIKKDGYNIMLETNGHKLTSSEFCKQLNKYVDCLFISFNPTCQDLIDEKAKPILALKNAVEHFKKVKTNTIITKASINYLNHIIKYLLSFRIDECIITYPVPIGGGLNNFDSIFCVIDGAFIQQLHNAISKDEVSNCVLQGLPYCMLDPYLKKMVLKEFDQIVISPDIVNKKHLDQLFVSQQETDNSFLPLNFAKKCMSCDYKKDCVGLLEECYNNGIYQLLMHK